MAYINPTCTILGSRSFCCGVCGATTPFSESLSLDTSLDEGTLLDRYYTAGRFRRSASVNRDLPELTDNFIEYSQAVLPRRQKAFLCRDSDLLVSVEKCPPILVYLIDASMPPLSLEYAVECISQVIGSSPGDCRVGFVMFGANSTGSVELSIFDLSMASPELIRATVESPQGVVVVEDEAAVSDDNRKSSGSPDLGLITMDILDDICDLQRVFPPLREASTAVDQALRIIGDFHAVQGGAGGVQHGVHGNGAGAAVDFVASLLQSSGAHPGANMYTGGDEGDNFASAFNYLGAKCQVFVGEMGVEGKGDSGGGGQLGRASIPGQRFDLQSSTLAQKMSTDEEDIGINVGLSNNGVRMKEALEYYNELGKKCCEVAMGVDIYGILDSSSIGGSGGMLASLYVPLNLRCGGSTCVTDVASFDGTISPIDMETAQPGTPAGMAKVCLSKTPWWRPTSFGGGLRLRTSQTFNIARDNDAEEIYQSGGIVGCATADGDDPSLYYIGTCDDNATLGFDLELNPGVTGSLHVQGYDGGGLGDDTTINPGIQMVYAYTSLVPMDGAKYLSEVVGGDREGEEGGEGGGRGGGGGGRKWGVVRRLAVFTTSLDTSNNIETVFGSMDCEALAVTLFNKFWIASINQGLGEASRLAHDWIVEALVAVYRSAEAAEVAMIESEKEEANSWTRRKEKKAKIDFTERLINRHGKLSQKDVLMAQGHEFLCSLPLLIYSLLNLDCIRNSEGGFQPSSDSRVCAALALGGMDATAMVKILAPRLECWKDVDSEGPAVNRVNLAQYAVTMALAGMEKDSSADPVLLVDSPQGVLVYYAKVLGMGGTEGGGRELDDIGDGLKEAVEEATRVYSTRPPVMYARAGCEGGVMLRDFLIEDSPVRGGYEAFTEMVVRNVKERLGFL